MYGWQPGVVTRTLQSDCHNANPIAWNQRMIFRIGGDISRGTPVGLGCELGLEALAWYVHLQAHVIRG